MLQINVWTGAMPGDADLGFRQGELSIKAVIMGRPVLG